MQDAGRNLFLNLVKFWITLHNFPSETQTCRDLWSWPLKLRSNTHTHTHGRWLAWDRSFIMISCLKNTTCVCFSFKNSACSLICSLVNKLRTNSWGQKSLSHLPVLKTLVFTKQSQPSTCPNTNNVKEGPGEILTEHPQAQLQNRC